MNRYLVHLTETTFYDVEVEADDDGTFDGSVNNAFDAAVEAVIVDRDRWRDYKQGGFELAEWTEMPVELLEEGGSQTQIV